MQIRITLLLVSLLAACSSSPPVPVNPCTRYCASYEEGYQWAGVSNLSDDRNCDGYTAAFGRGCRQQISDRLLSIAPGHDRP
jgi:hypothetical protein